MTVPPAICVRRITTHRIGDVMASVLASSAVDRGFDARSNQTIKLVSVASLLRTQH